MEIADQREVFGPSDEEFHSDKIVRIKGESVLSFRDGDQPLPPLLAILIYCGMPVQHPGI